MLAHLLTSKKAPLPSSSGKLNHTLTCRLQAAAQWIHWHRQAEMQQQGLMKQSGMAGQGKHRAAYNQGYMDALDKLAGVERYYCGCGSRLRRVYGRLRVCIPLCFLLLLDSRLLLPLLAAVATALAAACRRVLLLLQLGCVVPRDGRRIGAGGSPREPLRRVGGGRGGGSGSALAVAGRHDWHIAVAVAARHAGMASSSR